MPVIAAFDPGSVKAGYGVIRADGELLTYLECGVIMAPAGWDKYRRLAEIARGAEEVLDDFAADVVAIEAGFVRSQMGAITLGAARGAIGVVAARRGIAVVEYAPATVKLAAAGSGRAEKEQVARMVRARLRLQHEPEPDAADALAIAICHAHHMVASRRARAA
jgi:crossover junction endodeoxyribonuclease RuvC